jgi:hypothetical protein
MSWGIAACGLIVAGIMSGCAGMAEAYGSAFGIAKSRDEIIEQTMFNCTLLSNPAEQSSCKGESNVAI